MNTEPIKRALKKKKKREVIKTKDLLSSSSTLLNLAASGRTRGCFAKGHYYWFVGDSESGKAQPLTAKVLTINGFKLMKNMKAGDKVIDPDGGIAEVISIHPQGSKEVVEVLFSDGSKTECDADHLWHVMTGNHKRRGTHKVKTAQSIMEDLEKWEDEVANGVYERSNGNRRYFIPMTIPVGGFPDIYLPIDPYVMGALLGDGHLRKQSTDISTTDKLILEKVTKEAEKHGCRITEMKSRPNNYSIVNGKGKSNKLRDVLRTLGLGDVRSDTKFIPSIYLKATKPNRCELLRGLLDTDGYCGKIGNIEFYTVSEQLAKDVRNLVWSLGGSCFLRVKEDTNYKYKDQALKGKPCFQLSIKLPKQIRPFWLKRKFDRLKETRYEPSRRIVSITRIGKKPCQCISVNSKRGLYITDDYIVTHNTWLALAALAEASINPEFDDYRLIYDNSEHGALMNIEKYFGKKVADRLEPPRGTRENPIYSKTAEDMYFALADLFEDGRPFIFIEDSMDVLTTRADEKKFKKEKSKKKEGTKEGASMTVGAKAAVNAMYLPKVISGCRSTGSIVIIISQTRDNMGFGAQFNPDRAAGGRTLKFYCTLAIWTKIREKIKRKIRGKNRAIGIMSKVQIKKNRVQGKDRTIYVPIYNSSGVDDIGSCINYLIDEKHWKGTEETVKAPEFDFSGNKEDLVHLIEEESRESEIRTLVKEVWDEIELACKVERKSRYV